MIKWIGQHIWDFVSRFRNDVYLEDIADPGSDTDKFLVVDTNNKIGYRTGAEVLSDIGASSEATDLEFNGSTANGVLTYGGAAQIDVESTFTYDSGALELSSSSSNLPTITLTNSNADINPPAFVFQKTATGANNDDLGVIDFKGDDASNNVETYARIKGQIAEATHGSEEGRLSFQVASHDGEMQAGLIIASGDAEDEIDVTLGNGSASIVNLGGQKIRAKGDQTLQLQIYDISGANTDCSLLLGEAGVTTGSIGMNGPSHINVNADASELLTGTNVSGKNVNLSPSKGRGTGASGKVWMSAPPTHTVSGTAASPHDPAYHVFAHDTVDFFQYAATTTGSLVTIHSNDTTVGNGGELQFKKNAADTEDGEVLGKVTFYGEDEGNNNTQFAEIVASISESDEGDEAGKLEFKVAESDSTTTAMTTGLMLEGEHATDGEIDVTIGAGTGSTTTIAGDLTVSGGDITGPTDGDLFIRSDDDIALVLDNDNDGTSSVKVVNSSAANCFTLSEAGDAFILGDLTVGGGDIIGPTDGDLNIKSDGGIFLTLDTDTDETNQMFTITEGDGNGSFEYNASRGSLQMYSSLAGYPDLALISTVDDALSSGSFTFQKRRDDSGTQAGEDNDPIGITYYKSYNDAGTPELITYASTQAKIVDASDSDEAGDYAIKVTTSDGSTSALQNALTATGSPSDNDVDVTLGYGATSTVTAPGKANVLGRLTAGEFSLGGHMVDDIQVAGDTFADVDDQLMSAAAINDRIAAVGGGGGGKGFLQWYYYSANLSTTNGFYIEKWNDEYGVSSSINSQITDYNDTSSSHWQLIRGSRIVPYDATVTKFFVNVENSGTNEDLEVALWKASPSVTSRSGSTTATTIDHLCTLSYGFSSYAGSGTWTQSTTSFNATSLTQGDYLFVTLRRTSGSDGSSYHVHSTVTFDY